MHRFDKTLKLNTLFNNSSIFHAYSLEHFVILFIGVVLSILLYRKTRNWPYLKQRKLLITLSIVLSLIQLVKIPITLFLGTFNASQDLPLHLCNFLPFFLIAVFYFLSRDLWAIIFFWIILGCSQANFTPTIETSLFHWDALRYWAVHIFLVTLVLYPLINWKWKLQHADIWKNIIALNALALLMYVINLSVDSNYMYLNHKPPGKTLYSTFPEWPYYILVIEVILLIWSYLLFGIYSFFTSLYSKRATKK